MCWQIINKVAQLQLSPWSGTLDLMKPHQGLSIGCSSSHLVPSARPNDRGIQLFKIPHLSQSPSITLSDFYARGNDITAYYPADDNRNFSVQIDLRIIEPTDNRLTIEFWLSIQTHLLDTRPSVNLGFGLPTNTARKILTARELSENDANSLHGDEASRTAAIVSDTRNQEQELSTALLVHPLDQGDICWTNSQNRASEIELSWFGQFMEKGVIRRGRMQVILSKQPIPTESLKADYREFSESPLPLTV
jgi:hypothetical protein